MGLMRILSVEELHALKVKELGLDPSSIDLGSPEAIACAIRRAAGFLCPCSAVTLVRSVVLPLKGLVEDLDGIQLTVEQILEALVAHGDLLEHCDISSEKSEHSAVLLYGAPPSFIVRQSGAVLLFGIVPDHISLLPDELQSRIEYVNHVRKLPADAAENLRIELKQLGFVEISYETWLKAPPRETSPEHIARLDQLLESAPKSGEIPGLHLLDPLKPVRYYRGRWVDPKAQTGHFVGRRRQAYGADLWCYVEMRNGCPERFIGLPLAGNRTRGCDEGWRLQMAIDAQRGDPQRFRLREGVRGNRLLDFFSPVPMWAQRRWNAVGEPIMNPGSLFSYRFARSETAEELEFAREILWLSEIVEQGDRQ